MSCIFYRPLSVAHPLSYLTWAFPPVTYNSQRYLFAGRINSLKVEFAALCTNKGPFARINVYEAREERGGLMERLVSVLVDEGKIEATETKKLLLQSRALF